MLGVVDATDPVVDAGAVIIAALDVEDVIIAALGAVIVVGIRVVDAVMDVEEDVMVALDVEDVEDVIIRVQITVPLVAVAIAVAQKFVST